MESFFNWLRRSVYVRIQFFISTAIILIIAAIAVMSIQEIEARKSMLSRIEQTIAKLEQSYQNGSYRASLPTSPEIQGASFQHGEYQAHLPDLTSKALYEQDNTAHAISVMTMLRDNIKAIQLLGGDLDSQSLLLLEEFNIAFWRHYEHNGTGVKYTGQNINSPDYTSLQKLYTATATKISTHNKLVSAAGETVAAPIPYIQVLHSELEKEIFNIDLLDRLHYLNETSYIAHIADPDSAEPYPLYTIQKVPTQAPDGGLAYKSDYRDREIVKETTYDRPGSIYIRNYWQFSPASFPDSTLMAIIVITGSILGSLAHAARRNHNLSIRGLAIGIVTGFTVLMAIKGGRQVFLVETSEVSFSYNPYSCVLVALLAGMFTEHFYKVALAVVDDISSRVTASLNSPEAPNKN